MADVDALPLTEFQQAIKDLLKDATGWGKHCARNAIRHLEKAWEIRAIDKEMAAFRVITAEEEAATATFHTLKKYTYPRADLIRHRDHAFKAALFPFLRAVMVTLSVVQHTQPQVFIDKTKTPKKLAIRFNAKKLANLPDDDGKPLYAEPIPPLNMAIRLNDVEVLDFGERMAKLAEAGGFAKIIDYVRNEANFRNRILYAASDGIPSIEFADGFIPSRRDRVFGMLTLYLLIDQYPEHQLFVVQCLQGFLKLHVKFEPDLSAFENLPQRPSDGQSVFWLRPPSDP